MNHNQTVNPKKWLPLTVSKLSRESTALAFISLSSLFILLLNFVLHSVTAIVTAVNRSWHTNVIILKWVSLKKCSLFKTKLSSFTEWIIILIIIVMIMKFPDLSRWPWWRRRWWQTKRWKRWRRKWWRWRCLLS